MERCGLKGLFSASSSPSTSIGEGGDIEDIEKTVDRTINATLVLADGRLAITKLLTINSDNWQVSLCSLLCSCSFVSICGFFCVFCDFDICFFWV